MTNRGKSTTLSIAAIALIVVLIGSALAPALARLQRSSAEAQCQSNLRRWSQAMALYLVDNHDTYPTNRTLAGDKTSSIKLTPDEIDPASAKRRFRYGINWVEALYPYLWTMSARTSADWKSFRACPNASLARLGVPPAYMTYAFNYYMVELRSSLVRNPESLMMLREMDRHWNAVCRPLATPVDGYPISPWPNYDAIVGGPTNANLHGTGCYMAFPDGHVHYFTTDYFPAHQSPPQDAAWDPVTRRWYNFVYANPSTDQERKVNKTIAISP